QVRCLVSIHPSRFHSVFPKIEPTYLLSDPNPPGAPEQYFSEFLRAIVFHPVRCNPDSSSQKLRGPCRIIQSQVVTKIFPHLSRFRLTTRPDSFPGRNGL